jgi:hypothetical protein
MHIVNSGWQNYFAARIFIWRRKKKTRTMRCG